MSLSPGVHAAQHLEAREGPVLVDTHIWFWFVTGNETRLRPPVRRALDQVREAHGLLVSDASPWELAIKSAAGRVRLTGSPTEFVDRARDVSGFDFQPLQLPALLGGAALVGAPADPFDRVLIATARGLGVPFVTADRAIISYARSTRALAVFAVK